MGQTQPPNAKLFPHPTSFIDAVRGLLNVDPKHLKKRTAKKKATKKVTRKKG